MKLYSTQFKECISNKCAKSVDLLIKDHLNLLPAFPNKAFVDAIVNNPNFTINLFECTKFGGICSSKNEKCIEMRKKL